MLNRAYRGTVWMSALGVTLAIVGCEKRDDRLNAPPQGDSDEPTLMHKNFIYMNDNAMLHDSAVADIHFEPHTAELSGLGIRTLMRMGELLSISGGTIRYETGSTDEFLITGRLNAVREFLGAAGFDTANIRVESGMARSTGMAASDAIAIKQAAPASAAAQVGTADGEQQAPPPGP
ncbi:MAG: hypothetical protein DHS20C16_27460 [Phycisphaerae bacterium]|nr:MAG: hypothetical protein DHS20C16_27460 [Phycisphaerae bacterium]